MERIFLQFGEVANNSCVHLWNFLNLDTENKKLFGSGTNSKTLIYSERIGLKGIISQGSLENGIEASPDEEILLINQRTGRWTDMNYGSDFSESSYRELQQFDPSRTFISSFYDSKSKASFLEDFEEDVRKLAETCDWMERFDLVSESCGSIGASTLHSLEYLNDEFMKCSKTVISFDERIKVDSVDSVLWENSDKFDGEDVGKAIKLALTFEAIKDQKVSFIPISPLSRCTWRPFELNLSEAREACRFFSSIYFDIFGQQNVPTQGKFGSLIVSIPNNKNFNLSTGQFIESSINLWRKTPIVLNQDNYQFENIDLISYVDFDPKATSIKASEYLETVLNRPRPVWQLMEASGVASELAAGDYYQELKEILHQIKDLSEFSENFN